MVDFGEYQRDVRFDFATAERLKSAPQTDPVTGTVYSGGGGQVFMPDVFKNPFEVIDSWPLEP